MAYELVGETSAIIVSVLWTTCSLLFAYAGKRIGALSVNAIRIIIAVGLLGAAHIVIFGTIIPEANSTQWFYMSLSGIVGLAIGDFGYFGTLVALGPRRGTLIMSLNPIFSVIAGYFVLTEVLDIWTFLGIVVTLTGVTWVILEREEDCNEEPITKKQKIYGVTMGMIGAVGQGVGLVLAKYGMVNVAADPDVPLNPLSATLIRMIAGTIVVWLFIIVIGKFPKLISDMKDTTAVKATAGGAFFGPFLGVWLSMVAVTYAIAGVAATLMSLMPVIVIPFIWVLYKQRTSWRGIIGAVVAIVGVAILFLM
ncbi:MAG: DMT family transporter [Thermoplasmata archaeon]|nr:MAG: DMT family transporter [Thermoplasmata archaeon]